MIPPRFEDRLLTELQHVVAERPAPGAVAAPRPHRKRSPRARSIAPSKCPTQTTRPDRCGLDRPPGCAGHLWLSGKCRRRR
jgi:hypothetical protein